MCFELDIHEQLWYFRIPDSKRQCDMPILQLSPEVPSPMLAQTLLKETVASQSDPHKPYPTTSTPVRQEACNYFVPLVPSPASDAVRHSFSCQFRGAPWRAQSATRTAGTTYRVRGNS